MRWYRTFQLHYGWSDQARLQKRTEKLRHCRRVLTKLIRLHTQEQSRQHQNTFYWDDSERNILSDNKNSLASNTSINAAFSKYNECYRDGWEFTFVGCCHDEDPLQFCSTCHPTSSKSCCEPIGSIGNCKRRGTLLDDKNVVGKGGIVEPLPHPSQHQLQNDEDQCAFTTQFNVTALVPSVKRLYVDLWDTIELSLLGYYDAADDEEPQIIHDQYPVPAIMRILRTSFLPDLFEYLYFMVGLKPLAMKSASNLSASRRRRMRRGGGVLGPMLSRRFFGGTRGVKPSQQQQHQQPQKQRYATTAASTTISDLIMRPCFEYAWRGITASGDNMLELESSYAQVNGSTTTTTTFEEIISLSDAAATMSAWKLACFLQQRGVGCLRCEICDCIDLIGDDLDSCDSSPKLPGQIESESTDESDDELHDVNARENRIHPEASGRSTLLEEFHKKIGGGGAWISPCKCRDPVHRQCFERKLNLVAKYEPWERFQLLFRKLRTILTRAKEVQSSETLLAPKVWISYDNTVPVGWGWRNPADNDNIEDDDSVTAVDDMGRFRSPSATCDRCGERFVRTVRLPRSRWEVLTASLSDPISMMRAVSTFIHFVLACAFLAACEGMCSDASCSSHRILLSTPLGVLKWPTTGLNGLALAWWQLQQCCMLHIFFSRRFAAIVDRLWMGPISFFYFRLYFYFIVTSALLTASYVPMVSRAIRINFLESWIAPWILELLQPVGDAIALANLFQYAFVSTTVVCIFWRTNYRIFTVADGKEATAILLRGEFAAPDLPGVNNPERIARQNGARHVADNADPDVHLRHRAWGAGGGVNAANHPMYHGPW
jgi:hypothetical protein